MTLRLKARHVTGILGVCLLGFVASCAANLERKAQAAFQPAISAYHDGLRWKEFHRAARMIPTADRREFITQREANQAVFDITDYEIREIRWDPRQGGEHSEDPVTATVIVEFRHVWKDEGVLRVTRMEQKWKYISGGWLLSSQMEAKEEPSGGTGATSGDLL